MLNLPAPCRPDGALAPEVRLASHALDPAATLGSLRRHAVVFDAPRGFANEFYTLAVDAYVRDCDRHGQPQTALLGVQAGWLTEQGAIHRSIYLDCEKDRLVAVDWDRPMRPASVQFLCLGEHEQALHRELSARFPCPQLNSYRAAALADDKSATLSRWRDLETPASLTVQPGDRETARTFVEGFPLSVVKPNAGTEGDRVALLERDRPDFGRLLEQALAACWQGGAALIRQRRDGVCYRDPASGSCHTLALRLNLVHDGSRHRLTSGYAQLGCDAETPAACGRGGRIIDLHSALSGLATRACRPDRIEPPAATLWRRLSRDAERAAAAFEGLALVGLDVLLDLTADDRLLPVFVEANPRPAGLCRSRLLTGVRPQPATPSASAWSFGTDWLDFAPQPTSPRTLARHDLNPRHRHRQDPCPRRPDRQSVGRLFRQDHRRCGTEFLCGSPPGAIAGAGRRTPSERLGGIRLDGRACRPHPSIRLLRGRRLMLAVISVFWRHCRCRGIACHSGNFRLGYRSDIPRLVGLAGSSGLPPLYLAYDAACAEGSERSHGTLRARFEAGDRQVLEAMNRLAEFTAQAHALLLDGRAFELKPLMNEAFDLRRSICTIPPAQWRMIEVARNAGASSQFAGSGGAIVGIYNDEVMYRRLKFRFPDFAGNQVGTVCCVKRA